MPPPIHLIWRQWFAAFWSLAWPAWTLGSLVLFFGVSYGEIEEAYGRLPYFSLAFYVLSLTGQVLLFPRLLHKKFRTFRIALVRDDGDTSSLRQAAEVWRIAARLLGPQIAFLLAVSAFVASQTPDLSTLSGISSLTRWVLLFGVGPLSLRIAIDTDYQSFRFLTYAAPK